MGGLQRKEGGEDKSMVINFFYYVSNLIQYIPIRGDRVVGVVKTTGRHHRVDIGSAVAAVLPELAFEGATKRNKPNLQVCPFTFIWSHVKLVFLKISHFLHMFGVTSRVHKENIQCNVTFVKAHTIHVAAYFSRDTQLHAVLIGFQAHDFPHTFTTSIL